MRYQAKLERKQMVLFRIVDIATDLFAMSAVISYATMLAKKRDGRQNAIDLADVFCREARLRIETNFRQLFSNHDDQSYRLASKLLKGVSGGLTTLWRMKEMVGLGRASFPSRLIPREAIDTGAAAQTAGDRTERRLPSASRRWASRGWCPGWTRAFGQARHIRNDAPQPPSGDGQGLSS